MELENPIEKYITDTNHSLKEVIVHLRNTIILNFPNLHEHIKWNVPSYQFNGDDFLTFNLSNGKEIRLIFHRGAKVKTQPKEKLIVDDSNLLKWASNDRAIATFTSLENVTINENNLVVLITNWLKALQE